MAQFSRGITFIDGTSGHTVSEIHALIDNAHILPAFITDQPVATPVTADKFIFQQATTNTLKSISFQGFKDAFPKDAAATVYSLRRLGTAAGMAAAGNDTRLRNPVSGFRFGQGAGTDRAATAADFRFLKNLGTGTVINWAEGRVFYATLTGNRTYTVTGGGLGRQIEVDIKLNGFTVTINGVTNLATVGSGTAWARYYLTIPAPGTIVGTKVLS